MQQELFIDPQGRLMISKQHLLLKGIYTEVSYRNQKSKGRLEDVKADDGRWVYVDSLTSVSKAKVIEKFASLKNEYSQLLIDATNAGEDCAPMAVKFTAESLHINEPFIRSTIESYMNTHYTLYTASYLDLGLHSNSVKGYAKQCALVQWLFDFVTKIQTSEADVKRCEVLVRSFRMNLLTSITKIEFEVKIPRSETRFNKWFDDVLTAMDKGKRPQDIIQPKRMNNGNAVKVSDEQFRIAAFWHINGTNMGVATVYKKWVEYGGQMGWWLDENGGYNPPTEARLYQLLAPLKNPNALEKTDAVNYRLNYIPSVSRDLPEKKNHVWVIDGTAQNESVDFKGKVRQHIYAIKLVDVATLRMVGVSTLIGVKEPFYAVKEAIMMGIIETGYKPAIIHCDRGPAWRELERWCEENEIKLYPSIVGNARAKTIESLFNMFDNDITRFLKGYSGQNRTATGSINSKPSDKREMKGKHNARSASIAMEWAKTEGIKSWNERVIETLERKPCNKTPFEMWDEKESYVPKMSYTQICQMCGTLHERKLTINGLDISHETKNYTYYPSIETSEQRAIAERIFTYIPMDANTTNKLKIYILKGGDPAPVFSHDNKYLGIWGLKVNTAYIAETKVEKGVLDNYMALQYRVQETAKAINSDIKQQVSMHPDFERIEALGNEMLTGKRRTHVDFEKRVEGRYDKSALLLEEVEAKEAPRYKEIVDPDTGEIHRIELN
ncbi:MAG TPA: transposase family protein [Paludibacter sp.]